MTSIVSPGMSGSVRGCAEGIVGPWEVHVDALMTKLYTSIQANSADVSNVSTATRVTTAFKRYISDTSDKSVSDTSAIH